MITGIAPKLVCRFIDDPIPHVGIPNTLATTPNTFASTAPDVTRRFADPITHVGIPNALATTDSIPHVGIPNTLATTPNTFATTTPDVADPIPHVGIPVIPNTLATNAPIPHVETPNKFAIVAMTVQAKQVLRTAGFRSGDANQFVESALADENPPLTLEALIVTALQKSR